MNIRSLCLLLLGFVAHGAVAGIDFGSEFIKVSLVKPGSFSIVVDEQSKRKIPAVVSFDKAERVFGNNAVSLVVRNAKRSFLFMHRLLGASIDSPQVKELQDKGFPWKFVEIPGRKGAVGIQYDDETIFSPEELVAMSLEHIKKITDESNGGPVKDAVITVPAYWTQNQREAMLTAAELAGFHVLSLINQNTAAAVQYGVDRKYNLTDPPHNLVIYNMGSSSTEVSLVSYTSYLHKDKLSKRKNQTVGNVEIRGQAADSSLGGMFFDDRIVKHLQDQWNEKYPKADISNELRPMAKLRKAATNAKIVLSANKDTPINVQSLFNDVDFRSSLTRQQFYELSKDLLDRVTAPLERLLEDSKMAKEDIDAIVIVGGAVRIPEVQARLKEFMGKELTQNLNGDEAFSQGAAFRAANLSTAFQSRKLGLVDVISYPIGIRLQDLKTDDEAAVEEVEEEGEKQFSKRASLFKRNNRLAKRKTVAFNHTNDLLCTMHHDSPKILPPGTSASIAYFNITGMNDLIADEKNLKLLEDQKPRMSISFSLSSSSIVNLIKAEATLEEWVEVAVPKAKPNKTTSNETETEIKEEDAEDKTDAAETKEDEAKDEAKEEAKEEQVKEEAEAKEAHKSEEAKGETAEAEGETPEVGESQFETPEAEEEEVVEEIEYEYVLEKKIHRFPLTIAMGYSEEIVRPMDTAAITLSRKRLKELKDKDSLQIQIAISKNQLESYIYEARGGMQDEAVEDVTTEEQRDAVVEASSAAENWLYEQDDDGFEKFDDKLVEIKDLSGPIFYRAKELVDRPAAIEQALDLLNYTETMVAGFAEERPWIPESDKEKLLNMTKKVQAWLTNKTAEQETLQVHETPAFTSAELTKKLPPIAKFSTSLLKRLKPKPKVEKPKKKKKKKNATATNETVEEDETVEEGTAQDEETKDTANEGTEKETPKKEANEEAPKDEATEEEAPKDEL